MKIRKLQDANVNGKKVLVRVDLNVPMQNGKIEDYTRIHGVIPTLKYLLEQNATIIVMSHFGRPDGKRVESMSLKPLLTVLLEELAVSSINFIDEIDPKNVKEGVNLLENLRFHKEEEENDAEFAAKLASLGDIYVNDTFSCSHRAHASIVAITKKLPSYAGFLLQDEVKYLSEILESPKPPVAAIVGGAKVSTKLKLLKNLTSKINMLIVGGAMANSFLKAKGVDIGKSLHEPDLLDVAREIMQVAERNGCEIILPIDAVIAADIKNPVCRVVDITKVPNDMMILDVGPKTVNLISEKLTKANSLVWNGPLGAFEFKPFDIGTASVALSVAELSNSGKLVSVAGGGDIVSALTNSGLARNFTYISTGGGAFLEWLEGDILPGVAALVEV